MQDNGDDTLQLAGHTSPAIHDEVLICNYKNNELFESTQRRTTLRPKPCQQQLKSSHPFFSREWKRRLRGDLIQVFRIFNKFNDVTSKFFHIQRNVAAASNGMNIKANNCIFEIDKKKCCVVYRDKLSKDAGNVKSIRCFRSYL